MCHQDFASRLEEVLDSEPSICDEASSCSGCLKDTSRRRKSYFGHGFAVDVEHHTRRAVDHIVVRGANVPDPAHVLRHRPAAPAFPAEQELEFRGLFSGSKKE